MFDQTPNEPRLPDIGQGNAAPPGDPVLNLLLGIHAEIQEMRQEVLSLQASDQPTPARKYYSVGEFAKLAKRSEFTVREWCRLGRINAEKRDTGRGDAKSWKIPVAEYARWADDGLLPDPLNAFRFPPR